MDIFVGNLSFDATEGDVRKLFEGLGNVASVTILMRKKKKASKSRGFGFVQMPDEQQALAAIAALNGKEFMGRVINLEPARPKKEAQAVVEVKERRVNTPGRPGRYKSGRRTLSYMKRQALAGVQEDAQPRQRSQDNPMRWRKKKNQAKPWQKSPGEHKPWHKVAGEARPREKSAGEFKPWKKPAGDAKPWKKTEGEFKPRRKRMGESKPWRKSGKRPRPRQSRIESRRKPGGYTR